MKILIPKPVSIVICQCCCSLMDMHVQNQPKTTVFTWYLWCSDESKDLAFCHLCVCLQGQKAAQLKSRENRGAKIVVKDRLLSYVHSFYMKLAIVLDQKTQILAPKAF